MTGPAAARDVLARVPIDAPYGNLIQYRSYGVPESVSTADMNFKTLSFTLRDHRGKIAPVDQPVCIELRFSSYDPTEA